jgi:hypothetical protein
MEGQILTIFDINILLLSRSPGQIAARAFGKSDIARAADFFQVVWRVGMPT